MTDSPPKPRPRFQLHLSTCVVLMVVAGALVWGNLTVRHTETYRRQVEAMNALPDMLGVLVDGSTTDPFHLWGFPFVAYSKGHGYFYTPRFHPWGIVGNIFVGLAFLLATALTCELVIRRRARSRQDPAP